MTDVLPLNQDVTMVKFPDTVMLCWLTGLSVL